MKKSLLTIVTTASLLVLSSGMAFAMETWDCSYKGTWTDKGDKEGSAFTWVMKWKNTDEKKDLWSVEGKYKDEDGEANIKGTCTGESCIFEQLYTSGKWKNETYYFIGKYNDKESKTGVESSFKGTWGNSADNRTDGGGWEAKALCKEAE